MDNPYGKKDDFYQPGILTWKEVWLSLLYE